VRDFLWAAQQNGVAKDFLCSVCEFLDPLLWRRKEKRVTFLVKKRREKIPAVWFYSSGFHWHQIQCLQVPSLQKKKKNEKKKNLKGKEERVWLYLRGWEIAVWKEKKSQL
jgi:hypothetical protein